MIFVDSNIPMYLVGAAHPNRVAAQAMVEKAISQNDSLVTDAEVFQEILHRFTAIDRPAAIEPAFALVRDLVDEVLPIDLNDVEHARDIVLRHDGLSARDAIHAAVMSRHGIERLMSFDCGFDVLCNIERIA